MDNQYLIVLEQPDKNGESKRITSYWMDVHGETWEDLENLAKKDYPEGIYLRDEDGSIQAKLADGKYVWGGEAPVTPTLYVPTEAKKAPIAIVATLML